MFDDCDREDILEREPRFLCNSFNKVGETIVNIVEDFRDIKTNKIDSKIEKKRIVHSSVRLFIRQLFSAPLRLLAPVEHQQQSSEQLSSLSFESPGRPQWRAG